ncbi:MAG: FAD-dependent oxidoreductase [Actinomycetota bacterium]|nr:FAD-dependent oxidoreductase [Actinomycetota bacterium]
MRSAELVVLGAGPAGIGAAYRAARAGRSVVVLERSQGVGGAAGSFEVAGVRVDHGSHRLHPSIRPEILTELRRLLNDDLQLRRRRGRIRLLDRWIDFPLRAGDLVRHLPRSFALKAARDAVVAPFRCPRADTFADVVQAALGPAMGHSFYFPYARKLWGVEPGELSGEQARRRVSARSPLAVLVRALRGSGPARNVFYYPRGGYGSITERLAEGAVEAGAEIRLGSPVAGVELAEAARVWLADGSRVEGGQVWSTIPLPALARMTTPSPPAQVLQAAAGLKSRAMLLVYLVLERPRFSHFDAHYLPGPETPVSRLSEPKNYRDGPDPPDRTVLCLEVPCRAGGELWAMDHQMLAEYLVASLEPLGLPPLRPSAAVVRRLSAAYPIYRRGFEEAFAGLLDWADSQPRLLTFGRQGLFAHDNTHHALAMAWEAVDALGNGEVVDRSRWATARQGFRSHVVED